jgi:hypothetical protein
VKNYLSRYRTYGSGYPDAYGPGVENRGFPFTFFPIVFASPGGWGDSYLYREGEVGDFDFSYIIVVTYDASHQYGKVNDSSRPGGPLYQFSISSNMSAFHVLADNSTASFLQMTIQNICRNATNFIVSSSTAMNESQASYPSPEQAIQYYRASSVVLTLDGYNNTVALGVNPSAAPVPLPSNIDTNLVSCVNQTIGTSVPLIGGALQSYPSSSIMLLWFVWMIYCFSDL